MQEKWKSHTWTPPPPRDFPPPGVPFSMDDFVAELGKLPPTKAVASPFAPAIAWREHAATIGPVIYENLQWLWNQSPPLIPRDWRQGWLTFLPKPGKPTDKPGLLRPIALLNPVGKAALRLVTREAMASTLPNLIQAPQLAFWPGRSTTDAIARVMDHSRDVNGLLLAQSNKMLLQHSGHQRLACSGGIQVFLDLTQAFDCVPRDRLNNAILALLPRADLASLLLEWHHDTAYHISHLNFEDELATTLGVRQGCPSAPLLWTLFLHHCLTEFDPSWQWLGAHLTLFADDMQLSQLVQDENDVLNFLTKLGQFIDHLEACGLRLSAEKSVSCPFELNWRGGQQTSGQDSGEIRTRSFSHCTHTNHGKDSHSTLQTGKLPRSHCCISSELNADYGSQVTSCQEELWTHAASFQQIVQIELTDQKQTLACSDSADDDLWHFWRGDDTA